MCYNLRAHSDSDQKVVWLHSKTKQVRRLLAMIAASQARKKNGVQHIAKIFANGPFQQIV
jgi:hypothetical protein